MSEPAIPAIPAELQARLDAAGATDDESLMRALDANPDLKRDYLAFLETNQEQITQAWMAQLLAAFLAVQESAALTEFWQQVPLELKDTFIATIEARIAQAEQSGESDLAEGLRQRLDGLRRLRAEQSESESPFPQLPADLQARLDAVGVTDHESLRRALDADPDLKRDYLAFLETNQEQITQAWMAQLLAAFLAVPGSAALAEFWQQVPSEMEDAFLAAVEQSIARAEQHGENDLAAALRQRLDGVQQLRAEQQEAVARFERSLAALADADDEQLPTLWSEIPLDLEDTFLAAAEQQAIELEQAGDADRAERLHARVASLRQLQTAQRQLAEQPPTVRALLAFLRAETDDAARLVFADRRDLLQPYEVQQMVDEFVEAAPPEQRQRFADRAVLLRRLRQPSPQPIDERKNENAVSSPPSSTPLSGDPDAVTFNNKDMIVVGNLNQAGERVYDRSSHAEGPGATAITVNNIHEAPPEREWLRPEPLSISSVIPRPDRVQDVAVQLRSQEGVAITSGAVTIQGMPGIGKTVLSLLVQAKLADHYTAGTLSQQLGPEFRAPSQANMILAEWASFCYGGKLPSGYTFTSNGVRALLAEVVRIHGPLLIVLDDVWFPDALAPLLAARPRGAHLLITMRSRWVADRLDVAVYELEVLSEAETHELFRKRLGDRLRLTEDERWMTVLAESVGYHTMALDIVLRLLARRGADEWAGEGERLARELGLGQGFERLRLDAADRQRWVEISLRLSYDALSEDERRRFRLLGAMAPAASFDTAAAAQFWQDTSDRARESLNLLTGAALLSRVEERGRPTRWQQHALLRGYALALLRREGEYEAAATRHAGLYDDAMRAANDAQRFYRMLPEYSQLRHAFAWAVENDLHRTQSLIGNCAELQAAFGLARDSLSWCERALSAARQRGTAADTARAQGSLGNALSRVAALPGEDRRARLLTALAAYDEALRFYTPESAPLDYATTHNNRAALLSEIATLSGEDRRARLLAALAAYDEALRFRTPEAAPLDYAMTQGNLLNLYQAIADLPEEDRRARLADALRAGWIAFYLFGQLQHGYYQQQAARQLQGLSQACADDFATLWAELGIGPPPTWLTETDVDTDDTLSQPLFAFLNARSLEDLRRLIDEHPQLLTDAVEPAFAALLEQYAGDQQALALIEARRGLLQACREQGVEAVFAELQRAPEQPQPPRELRQALDRYLEQRRAAEQSEHDVSAWQAAVEAGEALLGPAFAQTPGANWEALRENLADAYNRLGIAQEAAKDLPATLAAFDRAIALQPGVAIWRRNRAGTLIDLERLDEAQAEIATARALEPDAPRLAELDGQLEQARTGGSVDTQESD